MADDLQSILEQAGLLDSEALEEITNAFGGMYERISPDIELILYRLGDDPSPADIKAAVNEIQSLLDESLAGFSGYMTNIIPKFEQEALALGLSHSLIILGLLGIEEPQEVPDAVSILGSMLSPDSPLYKKLQEYAGWHANHIADLLQDIITNKLGTQQGGGLIAGILAELQLAIANALADAMRLVRTALLYAYREATRLNYQYNGIEFWQWFATLDERVCMSCVVMHGTVHSVEESLNDHHNGRCAMLPVVDGVLPIEENAGTDWFRRLPESQQKAMMGKGKFEAWKAGKFDLPELSRTYTDDVYGEMRSEAPLKDLVK